MIVYLITNGSEYKIGITSDLERRLRQLQTGNANQLRVVISKEVRDRKLARSIEKDIHRGCSQLRAKGEWFRLTDKLLNVVTRELS